MEINYLHTMKKMNVVFTNLQNVFLNHLSSKLLTERFNHHII